MTALPAPHRRRPKYGRYLAWLVLAIILAIALLPIWVMVSTALTYPKDLFDSNVSLIPRGASFFNFARVLGIVSANASHAAGGSGASINFALALRNTVLYAGVIVIVQTLLSAMAAYPLARMRFFGRDFLFYLFISALMIPQIVLFIPNFILIRQLGWINTFAGLIAPTVLFSPFSVFFLRQFFLALPKEIEESARLDGASHFTIFWRLVLPISWPPIATLILLNSILMWNDFFWPFLVGRNSQTRLLTTVLQFFQTQTPNGVPDWTGLMAGSTLASIPVLILLVVLGRRVVQSIQFSGLK